MHEEQELPQPSFRLTWRDGTYRVSRPNVGETDCYTADQMREYGRQCASLAKPQPVGGALTNEQAQIFAHAIYNVSRGDFEATVDEAKAVYRAALATLSAPAAQPGEAVSDEAEAFEQLCREHDIFGTAAARQCEVFWRAGAAFLAPSHSDDSAVDRFACAMKAKMAKQRAKGYHGWDNPSECTVEDLSRMLIEHVPKGDPVDVANFAMMLHQRGSGITPLATPIAAQPAAAAPAVPDADEITRLRRGWNVEASDLDALLRLLGLTPADHRTEGGNLRLEKVRAALSQAAAVPEGWKLVPIEPTKEMVKAGNAKTWVLPSSDCYKAMLAAAPKAQAAAVPERDPHFGGHSYEASMLRNLLARIHGDGGHYLDAHGLDKAIEDADLLVANWQAAAVPEPAAYEIRDPKRPDHYVVVKAADARTWPRIFTRTPLYTHPAPQAAAVPEAVERDAARYRLLRRGQQWSVIDGIGDALRGGVLDAAIDRLAAGGQGDVSGEGEGS